MGKIIKPVYYVSFYYFIFLNNDEYIHEVHETLKNPEKGLSINEYVGDWEELEVNNDIPFPLQVDDIYKLYGEHESKVEKVVVNPDGSLTCYIDYINRAIENEEQKQETIKKVIEKCNTIISRIEKEEKDLTSDYASMVGTPSSPYAKKDKKRSFWDWLFDSKDEGF